MHIEHEPPMAFVADSNATGGMDVEMLQAILTEAHCRPRWQTQVNTNARALRAIELGEYDMVLSASYVPERRSYGYFSHPYRAEIIGVFARPGAALPKLNNLDEAFARRLRLIAPMHGWYGEAYQRLQNDWQHQDSLTTYKEPVVGIQLLLAETERADLLLIDADFYIYSMQTLQKQAVIWAMPPVSIAPTHLLMSRKSVPEKDLRSIDAAIDRLRANGRLHSIEAKYRTPQLMQLLAKYTLPAVNAP